MSRHVVLETPRRQVVIGWDPPTRRFFGQVFEKASTPAAEMRLLLEVGDVTDRREEPWTLDQVVAALAPYARVPAFMRRALEREEAEGQAELEEAWRQLAALVAAAEDAAE